MIPLMSRRMSPEMSTQMSPDGGRKNYSQRPPVPTTAIEYWHSEIQCTVPAWVGQLAGLSLAGINAPTVAVDTGFFRGKPVAQCSTSGNRAWLKNPLAGLPAAGTRPWAMTVARVRSVGGSQVILSAGFDGASIDAQQFAGASFFGGTFSGSGNLSSTVATDTAVHRFRTWRDGTLRHVKVDTTDTTSADAGVALATNTIAVGCQSNAAGGFANACVAFVMICSAPPTAAEDAALDAWASGYWY